jgi:hypothetical protein
MTWPSFVDEQGTDSFVRYVKTDVAWTRVVCMHTYMHISRQNEREEEKPTSV